MKTELYIYGFSISHIWENQHPLKCHENVCGGHFSKLLNCLCNLLVALYTHIHQDFNQYIYSNVSPRRNT